MTIARRSITLLLIAAVAGVIAAGALLWHDGHRMYAVASGSMLPDYQVGDLVLTAPPSGSYQVGDVITFPSPAGSPQEVTTHRVAEVDGTLLLTKGDANDVTDAAPVPADEVVGKVTSVIPKAGYVVVFFKQPTGVLSLLTALLALTALWGLFFPDEEDDAAATGSPARPVRGRHVLRPKAS